MKLKRNWLLIWMISFLGAFSVEVHAEGDNPSSDLNPLEYESLKFKKNTDYLHDNKKIELKNTLPQKQFDIFFDGRQQLPDRGDTSYLFQTSKRGEISTVSARSQELQLFSKEASSSVIQASDTIEEGSASKLPMIIIITLLIVSIGSLFLFMVPKLLKNVDSPRSVQTKS